MKSRSFDCAVVVLGMHRSGTSALAGALARCGLGLPAQLLSASDANERGFFESTKINELNNIILGDLGQNWLSLMPIDGDRWQSSDADGRIGEMAQLLVDEFQSTRVPVIKDPRICRLFPLWKEALAQVTNDVRVAFILRSPVEVARSLGARNQLETETGLLLWARYNLDAEFHTRHLARRFVSYDRLLDDWRSVLGHLGLPLGRGAIDELEIDRFLSSSLRHHRHESDDQVNVDLVSEMFGILSRWTTEGEHKKDYPVIDGLRRKLDEMAPVLEGLSEKGRLEKKRRSNFAAKAMAVESQLASREEQFVSVTEAVLKSLREIDQRNEDLTQQVGRMGEEIARSLRMVEDKDQLLRRFAAEKAQILAQTKAAEDRASSLAKEQDRLTHELASAEQRGNQLAAESDIARNRVNQLSETLTDTIARTDEIRNELRSVKDKYRSTQAILKREQGRAKRLTDQVAQARARIDQLEQGLSFKLSLALRSFLDGFGSLSLKGAAARKRQRERQLILGSELFDPKWYLQTYPDVGAARIDPVAHFTETGWREGRNPSGAFCTSRYLRRYPDVAELGVNPLVHFIEHGSFEGREIHGVGELPPRGEKRQSPQAEVGPALPVYSGARPDRIHLPWLRSCQLVSDDRVLVLDGLGVALMPSTESLEAVKTIVADFEVLCGCAGALSRLGLAHGKLPKLCDGWFATTHRLVTRWGVSQPAVVRALQYDRHVATMKLVGEGLVTGELDPVAFDLISPAMPILIVVTGCDGELLAAGSMAFPSLLRGGMHYPELIAHCGDAPTIDALEVSSRLEDDLRLMRSGSSHPTVQAIEIDLTGADGAGAMFQSSMRDLLRHVLQVDLTANRGSTDGAGEATRQYLQEAAELKSSQPLRKTGGRLTLAADMVPSLGIMVSSSSSEAAKGNRATAMSVIVCDRDSSQPAVRFDPPSAMPATGLLESGGYPMAFPRLKGGIARTFPAAIRQLSRPLDDAEMLIPDTSIEATSLSAAASVDWLVDPGQWDDKLLGQSLMALGLQAGIKSLRIVFTQNPSPSVLDIARSALRADPSVFDNLDDAIGACGATLIGHLGSGVVLHDSRTLAVLASLMSDPAVSSASCALVASAKRGKVWKTHLADGGNLSTDKHMVFGALANSPAEMIWRSTYPVIEPPRIWVARPEDVRRWRKGDHSGKETHLVTSLVTASLEGSEHDNHDELSGLLVPAPAGRAISAKVLVG